MIGMGSIYRCSNLSAGGKLEVLQVVLQHYGVTGRECQLHVTLATFGCSEVQVATSDGDLEVVSASYISSQPISTEARDIRS